MKIRKIYTDKGNNNNKITYIQFDTGKAQMPNNGLEYRVDDVVWIKENCKGTYEVIKNRGYSLLVDALEKKTISNFSLEINKFNNSVNIPKLFYSRNLEDAKVFNKIEENLQCVKNGLEDRYEWVAPFKGMVKDKLIMGLGEVSVFETDITLHHIYGIPYIPGQALKGCLRNYIIEEHFEGKEDKAKKNERFTNIFGGVNDEDKSVVSKVIFMDSFPYKKCKIERDIMTPHHKEYYSGCEHDSPTDLDQPNPVSFLVVSDATFEFNIAIDKDIINFNEDENIKEYVFRNFADMLSLHGIGAKTSVGYGYFNVVNKDNIQKDLRNEHNNRLREEKEKIKLLEEKRKFEEATKGMSNLQVKFYKINKIKDAVIKNDEVMKLYNEIDSLEDKDKIELATLIKEYLESSGGWKYKKGKDKKSKRIEKICDILGIDVFSI